MGKMYLLYEDDNQKLFWDESSPEEIAVAQSRFKQYLKEGYLACRIERDGNRGVQIVEFDPKAQEIILVSMVEGG